MRQLILDLLPADPPSFDNFVTGSNAEALTGLAAWLAPTNRESVFFVWGEAGAGKTHLLQACPAAYCDARPGPGNCRRWRLAQDVYAVDHLEALVDGGQIVLFNLINRLRGGGGRLLAAGRRAPLADYRCARICAPAWGAVWFTACTR
jgi:DnaA family protein